jgi:fibronectin type 3 domain-containing protein
MKRLFSFFVILSTVAALSAQTTKRPAAPQATTTSHKSFTSTQLVTPAVVGSHSVVLTWTQSTTTSPAITGNKVYRGTASGGETLLYTSSAPIVTYTDGPFATGTTYYYRVTATNANGESGYSNEVSAVVPSVPPAPTALASTLSSAPGSQSVVLTWTQSSTTAPAITANNVYRGTASGNEVLVYSSTSPIITYTDGPYSTGATYYYRVTAVSTNGESAYSNEISQGVPTVPTSPSALSATEQ